MHAVHFCLFTERDLVLVRICRFFHVIFFQTFHWGGAQAQGIYSNCRDLERRPGLFQLRFTTDWAYRVWRVDGSWRAAGAAAWHGGCRAVSSWTVGVLLRGRSNVQVGRLYQDVQRLLRQFPEGCRGFFTVFT